MQVYSYGAHDLDRLYPADMSGWRSVRSDGMDFGIHSEEHRILICDPEGDRIATTTTPAAIQEIVDAYALGLAHGAQAGKRAAQVELRRALGLGAAV